MQDTCLLKTENVSSRKSGSIGMHLRTLMSLKSFESLINYDYPNNFSLGSYVMCTTIRICE